MQEQRNKRLLMLLLVLSLVTGTVFWLSQNESTIEIDKSLFLVPNLETIDRVALESQSGKIELAYNGSRWKVNEQYDADRDLIKVLFATMKQAVPRRPVSSSLKDSIARALTTYGTKVTLFQNSENKGSFLAGGNPKKTQSYFLEPESGNVYIMGIPGYRVYVSGIFELNEGGWRDKTIFNFHWRNFQSLRMEYPGQPKNGFSVSLSENGIFGVESLPKTDTIRLASYMDHVFALKADEMIPSVQYADSLEKSAPEAVLTVQDIANRHYVLRVYPAKTDLVPILLGDNQAFNIDRRKLQPLLRTKAFFAAQ